MIVVLINYDNTDKDKSDYDTDDYDDDDTDYDDDWSGSDNNNDSHNDVERGNSSVLNKPHSAQQIVPSTHTDMVEEQYRSELFVGCLMSQQHASVSQGWICSDNSVCCHTEVEVTDQIFCLTQSQYADTGPTSPCADPIIPVAWQGSHWNAHV